MAPQSYKDIFAENSTVLIKGRQELREKFFDWYDVNSNEYDEEDVKQLRENDYYCQRFVAHSMGLNDRKDFSFDMVKSVFKWRKEIGANHMKDSDFPEEFFKSDEFVPYRKDKEGNVTILLRMGRHVRDSRKAEIFRRFLIHTFEKIEAKFDRRKHVTILVDCKGVGFSNIDLDLTFFMRTLFLKHYPLLLAYVVVMNAPMIVAAVWKILKSCLPQNVAERTFFVDDKTIYDYIEGEDLPEDMGGLDKTVLPLEDPISNLPESLLTDIQTTTVAVK